jgi:ABC-2 type transport system permease protein
VNGLAALIRKEIREQLRTYRLVVVAGVFLLFGISTPLMLKYLPEFLKLAGENMQINMPPPTAAQALVEYAGSVGQIGVLVAVLVAMGSVANELQRGTAVMTLSKPVTRAAFITAKFAAMSLTFVVSLAVASALCLAYTVWLIGSADAVSFFGLNLLLAVFLMFGLAVTVLFSSLFKSSLAAGGTALGVVVGQAVLSVLPWVGDYMPGRLLGWGNALFAGSHSYWGSLAVTIVLTGLCLYFAQRALRNKEMQ